MLIFICFKTKTEFYTIKLLRGTMIAILDCGTTNTKCYLVGEGGRIIGSDCTPWGCNGNTDKKAKELYLRNLVSLVDSLVTKDGMANGKLNGVVAFGMISSDFGIRIVPHLVTPTSLDDLREGLYEITDEQLFGCGVRFFLVRGVRNPIGDIHGVGNLHGCDFMRGEETQVMGVRELFKPEGSFNVISLGTHCKVIHMDGEGRIIQSMTTMSGQLYDCLVNQTVVGKSVRCDGLVQWDHLDEMVALAQDINKEYGVGRAFLLPRFMESFTDITANDRRLYLEAVLAQQDILAIHDYLDGGRYAAKLFYIIGSPVRAMVLKSIIAKTCPDSRIMVADDKKGISNIAVLGALSILHGRICI